MTTTPNTLGSPVGRPPGTFGHLVAEPLLTADGIGHRPIDAVGEVAGRARRFIRSLVRPVLPPRVRYLEHEAGARTVRNHEVTVIPGLLQTEPYFLALWRGAFGQSEAEAAKRWETRAARQSLHRRERPPHMEFLIPEAAIDARIGGADVMREQLERLLDMASRSHVSVQVVPSSVDAHAGLRGPIVHIEHDDPDRADIAYWEGDRRDDLIEDPTTVRRHLAAYKAIEEVALTPEESAARIRRSIEALRA